MDSVHLGGEGVRVKFKGNYVFTYCFSFSVNTHVYIAKLLWLFYNLKFITANQAKSKKVIAKGRVAL